MIRIRDFIFKEEKRKIPSMLRELLTVDAYLTNMFVNWAEQVSLLRRLKAHHKVLDVRLYILLIK